MELPKGIDFDKELDGDAIRYQTPRASFEEGQIIGRENLPREQVCELASDISDALIREKGGPYAHLDGVRIQWLACTHLPGQKRAMPAPKDVGYPAMFRIADAWFRGHAKFDVIAIVHAGTWDTWQREGQHKMMTRAVASVLARLAITESGTLRAYKGSIMDPPGLVRIYGPSNLTAVMEFIAAFNEWQENGGEDLSVSDATAADALDLG